MKLDKKSFKDALAVVLPKLSRSKAFKQFAAPDAKSIIAGLPATLEQLIGENCDPAHVLMALAVARTLGLKKTVATLASLTVEEGQTILVDGDLHVDGDIANKGGSLIVLGNLTVAGSYCQHGELVYSQLAVGGDLALRYAATEGDIVVAGRMTADVVYVWYNDYVLCVAQELCGRFIWSSDHAVLCPRMTGLFEEGVSDRADYEGLLVPSLIDRNGAVRGDRLRTYIQQGKRILRA